MSSLICDALSAVGWDPGFCGSGKDSKPKPEVAVRSVPQETEGSRSFLKQLLFGGEVEGAVGCRRETINKVDLNGGVAVETSQGAPKVKESPKRTKIESAMESLIAKDEEVRSEAARILLRELEEIIESGISLEEEEETVIINRFIKIMEGDYYSDVRAGAAENLGKLSQSNISSLWKTKIVEHLILALQDDDPDLRSSGTSALCELAKSDISFELKTKMITPLIDALFDEYSEVRKKAADALGTLDKLHIFPALKTRIVTTLVRVSGIPELSVRVAWALAYLAGSDASSELKAKIVPLLIQALRHKDRDVQLGAVKGLRNLVESDISPKLKVKIKKLLRGSHK